MNHDILWIAIALVVLLVNCIAGIISTDLHKLKKRIEKLEASNDEN